MEPQYCLAIQGHRTARVGHGRPPDVCAELPACCRSAFRHTLLGKVWELPAIRSHRHRHRLSGAPSGTARSHSCEHSRNRPSLVGRVRNGSGVRGRYSRGVGLHSDNTHSVSDLDVARDASGLLARRVGSRGSGSAGKDFGF